MRKLLFLLTIALFFLPSCSEDEPYNGNIIPAQEIDLSVRFHYKDGIYMEPIYNYGSSFLYLQTKEIFGCCNYPIRYKVVYDNHVMTVVIIGVEEVDICLTALGPAYAHISIKEDTEKVVFRHQDKTIVFDINITDEWIILDGENVTLIDLQDSKYYRRPHNSFAVIGSTTRNTAEVFTEFLSVLTSGVELIEFSFEEDGVVPWQTHSSENNVNYPTKFFKYKTKADFDLAGEILYEFSRRYIPENSAISIMLNNYDGESHLSWRLPK